MKLKMNFTALLFILAFSAFPQNKATNTITPAELRAHLEFIASDYMQGRDFGTAIPGLDITADYLKAECTKMGLKPGTENFMQKVELISLKADPDNTFLKLKGKSDITYENKDIFSFLGGEKSDTIEGEIVFAGYGWYDEETKYNDYEGLDIKDKIVVAMTRNREAVLDTALKTHNINSEMRKIQRSVFGGAKALVIVPDPLNSDNRWFNTIKTYMAGGMYRMKGKPGRQMPGNVVFANSQIADEILKESGKTLRELQQEINGTGKPKSFAVRNVRAEIVLGKKVETVYGKNIIAVLEGSDPVLKNECVVLSAHYDHIGIDPNGDVNNGADDNGSGTAALLEIAEAFALMKKAPKRSIVFAWVTAEEKGLFGSEFYTQNPIFPLEKTVLNINLDMVGRSAINEPEPNAPMEESLMGPNGVYIISGGQSSELTAISNKTCKQLGLIPSDAMSKDFLNRSDYYHFYKHGIPVLGLSTGLHEDYHRPTDEMNKMDYVKMKRLADYSFLVANKVANQIERIVVDKPVEK